MTTPLSTIVDAPAGSALYESVKEGIATGRIEAGAKLASVRRLQEQYDIGYQTVLRTLARLEKEGLVTRRHGAGTFVRKPAAKPDVSAEELRQIDVIAVPPKPDDGYARPTATAVVHELRRLGWEGTVRACKRSREGLQGLASPNRTVICAYPSMNIFRAPPAGNFVFVAHDMDYVWPGPGTIDVVCADARQGAALAGRYLREQGCRSIVIAAASDSFDALPWPFRSPFSTLRIMGFELGWGEPIIESQILTGYGFTPRCGATLAAQIVKCHPLPDAVFAVCDDIAEGVSHALISHGIIPGKDIKLMGFDGQPKRFETDPLLTSINVPLEELGRAAVRLALERVHHPDRPGQRLSIACALRKGDTA